MNKSKNKKLYKVKISLFKHHECLDDIVNKYKKINRLIKHVCNLKNRVKYQYTIIDSIIYFRVKLSKEQESDIDLNIREMFCFKYYGLYGDFDFLNCCEIVSRDDVKQYKIYIEEYDNNPSILIALMKQLRNNLINMVPHKSKCLKYDLPIID